MNEFLGRKVLIYQNFKEPLHPKPPFSAVICADFKSRWLVKFRLSDGNYVQKRVLKGVCSSKPIDKSVDKSVISDQTVLHSKQDVRQKLPKKDGKNEEIRAKIQRKRAIKPRI